MREIPADFEHEFVVAVWSYTSRKVMNLQFSNRNTICQSGVPFKNPRSSAGHNPFQNSIFSSYTPSTPLFSV